MTSTTTKTAPSRYIPQGATPVPHPDGLGIVYCFQSTDGRPAGMGYIGKQSKAAWHYGFATTDERDKHIAWWFGHLTAHQVMMHGDATARKQAHSVQVGDIVVNSWGWEQTNVDFYQVVKTSAQYIWIRPIEREVVINQRSAMAGLATPLPGQFKENGATTRHGVGKVEDTYTINFEYGSGRVHTPGQKHYCSWYG